MSDSYFWLNFSFSKEVAIFCSFLLGLGDSCFNTQLLSILGFLYSEDSAPAFAIFKFVQVLHHVTFWMYKCGNVLYTALMEFLPLKRIHCKWAGVVVRVSSYILVENSLWCHKTEKRLSGFCPKALAALFLDKMLWNRGEPCLPCFKHSNVFIFCCEH